jgi:hypothetical protein
VVLAENFLHETKAAFNKAGATVISLAPFDPKMTIT